MHFPPLFANYNAKSCSMMHRHGKAVLYGHIHGQYDLPQVTEEEGIEFVLISETSLTSIPKGLTKDRSLNVQSLNL